MSGLIIRQYRELILGEKTETRRLKLPPHLAVGKERMVVPRRAAPAYWFGCLDNEPFIVSNPADFASRQTGRFFSTTESANEWLERKGFLPARIRIDKIIQEELRSITFDGALREGIPRPQRTETRVNPNKDELGHPVAPYLEVRHYPSPREQYARLWDVINTRPGLRWQDNPTVYVVGFKRNHELAELIRDFQQRGVDFSTLPSIDY